MCLSGEYANGYITRSTKSNMYEIHNTADTFSQPLKAMAAIWKAKVWRLKFNASLYCSHVSECHF
jgi:hypothetical protein